MQQGQAAASSSRGPSCPRGTSSSRGGSAGPSGGAASRPRKSGTTPPVAEREHPAREHNCGDLWCKTACEGGSTACKPCDRDNCSRSVKFRANEAKAKAKEAKEARRLLAAQQRRLPAEAMPDDSITSSEDEPAPDTTLHQSSEDEDEPAQDGAEDPDEEEVDAARAGV
jgi:hypothetical protein